MESFQHVFRERGAAVFHRMVQCKQDRGGVNISKENTAAKGQVTSPVHTEFMEL